MEMIETMCNEILDNYTKKEDQLMSAAFGTRPKRRLNRVMDALNFEYPDYERLDRGARGVKRKRVVSILSRQAARSVKEDEDLKKQKQDQSQRQQLRSGSLTKHPLLNRRSPKQQREPLRRQLLPKWLKF
jgi:hypothetical protein